MLIRLKSKIVHYLFRFARIFIIFLSEFLDKRKNNRNVQNNDIKILMQSHFTVVSKAISRRTNKSVTQLPCIFTTLYSLKQDTDMYERDLGLCVHFYNIYYTILRPKYVCLFVSNI